jgi:hypothetical protein
MIKEIIKKLSSNSKFDFWITFLQFCLKKWIVICVFGFGFGGLGLLFVATRKAQYTSRLTFTVDIQSMNPLGGLSGLASSMGFGGLQNSGSVFEGDNLIELLKSKLLIEKTLLNKVPYKNFTFVQKYINDYELNEAYAKKEHLKDITFPIGLNRSKLTYHQDSILKDIYLRIIDENLKVKSISNKISINELKIKSKSPVFSRYFPETLLNETSKYYIEIKTKKARINYNILKMQSDSVRNELNNSIFGVAESSDNTFGLNPALATKRVQGSKKQFDVQMNSIILGELVKNTELARFGLLNETPLIQTVDLPRYPLDQKIIRKLHGIIIGGFFGGTLIIVLLFLSFRVMNKED